MRPSPFLVPKAPPPPHQQAPPEGFRLFSVNGPLARNVPDLALLLDAMVAGTAQRGGRGRRRVPCCCGGGPGVWVPSQGPC